MSNTSSSGVKWRMSIGISPRRRDGRRKSYTAGLPDGCSCSERETVLQPTVSRLVCLYVPVHLHRGWKYLRSRERNIREPAELDPLQLRQLCKKSEAMVGDALGLEQLD